VVLRLRLSLAVLAGCEGEAHKPAMFDFDLAALIRERGNEFPTVGLAPGMVGELTPNARYGAGLSKNEFG
jgi:hypothetical protein